MLPLEARRHGSGWPSSIEVKLENGAVLEGRVVWIEAASIRALPHWTAPLRPLIVRDISATDDSSGLEPGTGPYLLAPLPVSGEGELRMAGQKLRPVWLDRLPATSLIGNPPLQRRALDLAAAPDVPDPFQPPNGLMSGQAPVVAPAARFT